MIRNIKENLYHYNQNNFEKILKNEQDLIIKRISVLKQLPKDIAPNSAFRENILACFVSIFSHTPLFICGKPGSSKTIALQILKNSFRGQSTSECSIRFFNNFPVIYLFEIQGSDLCKWEGVFKIFQKAYAYSQQNKIGLIFFDELGLIKDPRILPGIKRILKNNHQLINKTNKKNNNYYNYSGNKYF